MPAPVDQALLRPSAALLAAHIAVSTAIEEQAVAATPHDPTTIDLLLRVALSPNQRLRAVDLCRQLQLNAGYVSRRLDRAEADGLLIRQPDENDRRAQIVVLTTAGQAAVDDFVPRLTNVLNTVIHDTLTATETQTLIALLTKVEDAAVELLNSPPQD